MLPVTYSLKLCPNNNKTYRNNFLLIPTGTYRLALKLSLFVLVVVCRYGVQDNVLEQEHSVTLQSGYEFMSDRKNKALLLFTGPSHTPHVILGKKWSRWAMSS